jgi:hypothetical protein
MRKNVLGMAVALLVAGCGDDGGDGNGDGGGSAAIASGAVTGKVGGQPWTVAGAQVDAFLSDEQTFWVDLSAVALTSCSDFGGGNGLILNVPKQPGSYSLSLMLNATFVVEGGVETENLIATKGSLRVDEVTSAIVRGGVSMTYDANNSVSGEFEAVVCSE